MRAAQSESFRLIQTQMRLRRFNKLFKSITLRDKACLVTGFASTWKATLNKVISTAHSGAAAPQLRAANKRRRYRRDLGGLYPMKLRIIASVLAACLIGAVVFAGCNNNSKTSDGSKIIASGDSAIEETVDTKVDYASTIEEYIGSLIDLDLYELSKADGNGESVYALKKQTKVENIDKSITFGDNSKVSVPTTVQELEKAGWSDSAVDKISVGSGGSFSLTLSNKDKKQFNATVYNTASKSKKSTASEAAASDCEVLSVMVPMTTIDNDGKTTKITKLDSAVSFKLASGITEESTIPDVIEKFGNPTKIQFSEYGAFCFVAIYYINGSEDTTEKECFRFWFNSKKQCEFRDFSITMGTE